MARVVEEEEVIGGFPGTLEARCMQSMFGTCPEEGEVNEALGVWSESFLW